MTELDSLITSHRQTRGGKRGRRTKKNEGPPTMVAKPSTPVRPARSPSTTLVIREPTFEPPRKQSKVVGKGKDKVTKSLEIKKAAPTQLPLLL